MKKKVLNKFIHLLVFLCLTSSAMQAQDFTWVKGANVLDQFGTYGSIGVPAANNNPGSRGDAVQWRDMNGNLWLFGGFGFASAGIEANLNDLWKYNPASNQWTWMKGDNITGQAAVYGTLGVAAPANKPGARAQAMGWTDNSGNLWLMGGYYLDSFLNPYWYNDLWKYNIASNQWTWVSGSNVADQNGVYGSQGVPSAQNVPGARYDAATWMDASGNMWLFGGLGFDGSTPYAGYLNDLWRYNPSSNQWTWISGTTAIDQNGIYGTQNVPSGANRPGSRVSSRGVSDGSGNFWLYGGFGLDLSSSVLGELGDLWRYNPGTNQWTWVNGSNATDQNGTYGSMGSPSSFNQPGGRESHSLWIDGNANIWLFGGFGFDAGTQFAGQLSDLWKYSLTSGQWTWVKGPNVEYMSGVYGTQGIAAVNNIPGARKSASSWIDLSNRLWLFGGIGYEASNLGIFNDLWSLSFCVAAPVSAATSQSLICPGNSAVLSASGAASYAWSTGQFSASIVVSPTVNTVYIVTGTDANGCINTATVLQGVAPSPSILIASSSASVCSGQQATLTASGALTYTWNGNQQGAVINVTPAAGAIYSITGMNANGCYTTALYQPNVLALPLLSITSTSNVICKGQPVALIVSGAASYSWHTAAANSGNVLLVTPAVSTTYSVTGISAAGCRNTAAFTQTVAACTGIPVYESQAKGFKIYPNPNNGEFYLDFDQAVGDGDLLIVTNALGQVVHEQKQLINGQYIHINAGAGIYQCTLLREAAPIQSTRLIIR